MYCLAKSTSDINGTFRHPGHCAPLVPPRYTSGCRSAWEVSMKSSYSIIKNPLGRSRISINSWQNDHHHHHLREANTKLDARTFHSFACSLGLLQIQSVEKRSLRGRSKQHEQGVTSDVRASPLCAFQAKDLRYSVESELIENSQQTNYQSIAASIALLPIKTILFRTRDMSPLIRGGISSYRKPHSYVTSVQPTILIKRFLCFLFVFVVAWKFSELVVAITFLPISVSPAYRLTTMLCSLKWRLPHTFGLFVLVCLKFNQTFLRRKHFTAF